MRSKPTKHIIPEISNDYELNGDVMQIAPRNHSENFPVDKFQRFRVLGALKNTFALKVFLFSFSWVAFSNESHRTIFQGGKQGIQYDKRRVTNN